MVYTWEILADGTATFAPVLQQLGNIVEELTPYIVYIGLGVLTFALAIRAVKWIVGYFSGKAKGAVRGK